MARAILTIAVLLAAAGNLRPNQAVYPRINRETLNGVWEGVAGIGSHPVIFHIVIAPQESDSYLSEFYPDSMRASIVRLDACTIADGKVKLHFRSVRPVNGRGWWFEGEGLGDASEAWLDVHFGTDLDKSRSGPPTLRLEKGTWVRRLGEASIKAAEDIAKYREQTK
jgi:hypothetical protein